jgi:glycerate dehydrogenase
MKVVVCQGDPIGGSPSREVLIDYWKEQFADCPQLEVVYRGGFTYDNLEETIGDADALLGVWIRDDTYTEEFFQRFPKLKYIASFAHGFGKIDKEAAARHGVTFTNTIYGDMTIAQFGMALLLDICHNVRLQADYYKKEVDAGNNIGAPGRGLRVQSRQIELYEKTIGIIGLGAIGLWMARMAAGFGMKVIAYSRHVKTGAQYDFIEQVSLEELYARSDVISIHCPATDETTGMINKDSIAKMKDGVILINTARGVIINEEDLVEALNSGKIYAAGLDVVQNEPLDHHIPLMDCPNAVLTPHIAWAPEETRYRTVRIAAQNFKNWCEGHPTSVIS